MRNNYSNKSVRLLVAIGLTALSVFFVACKKDKNKEPSEPGTVENPNWVVTVDDDLPASMTAIIKVSFEQSEGSLAAFMGEYCCGVAKYLDGLYWLYISPAPVDVNKVQLRYYSIAQKHIYTANETFPFKIDTQLGSVSAPYTPTWTLSK